MGRPSRVPKPERGWPGPHGILKPGCLWTGSPWDPQPQVVLDHGVPRPVWAWTGSPWGPHTQVTLD